MRSNGLLKWLMIPLVCLLVFVGLRLSSDQQPSPTTADRPGNQLTPEEMQALGIEGDTPRDTVATLVAQVKQLRGELQASLDDNERQSEENRRLRQRESTIDQRVQRALAEERSRFQQTRNEVASDTRQTRSLLNDLERRLDDLGGTELPVGLGLEGGDIPAVGGIRWIEPDDKPPSESAEETTGGNRLGITSPFASAPSASRAASGPTDTESKTPVINVAEPVYTVPANATLMGSISMTALIGRIPIDGTVNYPYPFKVLIGPDNLTANGIDLPEVTGAVVSGTASGDWTLSCVRGQIQSITFVFQDGSIRTVPEITTDENRTAGNRNTLGWISDPYGIPCVSGDRRSNAQQYLSSRALITAAGAGAASFIDSDSGNVAYVSNSNGTLGTVGISGDEAMGRILAGGVQDMSAWVNKLYGEAFAAVYVPPGADVAVHIEKPLEIDFDPNGRRVNHRLGGADHVSPLD